MFYVKSLICVDKNYNLMSVFDKSFHCRMCVCVFLCVSPVFTDIPPSPLNLYKIKKIVNFNPSFIFV